MAPALLALLLLQLFGRRLAADPDAACAANACLTLHPRRLSFQRARDSCTHNGGYLPELRDAAQDAALRPLLARLRPQRAPRFWVGLTLRRGDCVLPGEPLRGFRWLSGDAGGGRHSSWGREPAPTCTEERCVRAELAAAGAAALAWTAGSCHGKAAAVCRFHFQGSCAPLGALGGGAASYTAPFSRSPLRRRVDALPVGTYAHVRCPGRRGERYSVCRRAGAAYGWTDPGPFCADGGDDDDGVEVEGVDGVNVDGVGINGVNGVDVDGVNVDGVDNVNGVNGVDAIGVDGVNGVNVNGVDGDDGVNVDGVGINGVNGVDVDGVDVDAVDVDGVDNVDGVDAIGVDGINGVNVDGVDGDDAIGVDGVNGVDAIGVDGVNGVNVDGVDGVNVDGVDGVDAVGVDGINGVNVDGVEGVDGLDGDGVNGINGVDDAARRPGDRLPPLQTTGPPLSPATLESAPTENAPLQDSPPTPPPLNATGVAPGGPVARVTACVLGAGVPLLLLGALTVLIAACRGGRRRREEQEKKMAADGYCWASAGMDPRLEKLYESILTDDL